jgi:hypothetical protein
MVSRKPLGSLTSNARLFHSVSRGSDVSVMPASFARFAISSTLPGAERQARFLVLVLKHSGVCLPPAFARLSDCVRAAARQAGSTGASPVLRTAGRRIGVSTS